MTAQGVGVERDAQAVTDETKVQWASRPTWTRFGRQ